jgi:cell shape-determining protein MreC
MPGPVRKPTRRSTSLLFIALFLALATVIGLASYGVTLGSLAFSGVQRVARTLGGAVSAATESVVAYGHALLFARGIYAENETLRSENQYLDARLRLALGDHDELKQLQAQLMVQQQLPVKSVLAQVTGRAMGMSSMDVFIDHGTALGVADGAGVFVADSTGQVYVYGKVRGAFKSNATVIPSPASTVAPGRTCSSRARTESTVIYHTFHHCPSSNRVISSSLPAVQEPFLPTSLSAEWTH